MTDKNDKEERQKIAEEKQKIADNIKKEINDLLKEGKSGFSLDIYEEIKKNLWNNEPDYLASVIEKCKSNDDTDIFTKVVVIDSLYSTNLNKNIGVVEMFKFIKRHIEEVNTIINSVDKTDETSIGENIQKLLKDLNEEEGSNNVSFISKYLTTHQYFLHNKQHIQICDKVVRKRLEELGKNNDFYKKIIEKYKQENKYKKNKNVFNFKHDKDGYKVWYEIIGKILEAIWKEDNELKPENFGRRDFDWYIWFVYRNWNNKNTN